MARAGAPVLAPAVSRHPATLDYATRGLLDPQRAEVCATTIEAGHHDERFAFTAAHLHTPDKLAAEMGEAGLEAVEVFGVQGCPRRCCARGRSSKDPAVIAASSHLLAVATCQPAPRGRASPSRRRPATRAR